MVYDQRIPPFFGVRPEEIGAAKSADFSWTGFGRLPDEGRWSDIADNNQRFIKDLFGIISSDTGGRHIDRKYQRSEGKSGFTVINAVFEGVPEGADEKKFRSWVLPRAVLAIYSSGYRLRPGCPDVYTLGSFLEKSPHSFRDNLRLKFLVFDEAKLLMPLPSSRTYPPMPCIDSAERMTYAA